jgi:hypothetical protein
MDWFYFIIRHTPFWAVPLGMISFQFAYVYWVREFRRIAFVFGMITAICLVAVAFYYWAGGPEHVNQELQSFFSIIF